MENRFAWISRGKKALQGFILLSLLGWLMLAPALAGSRALAAPVFTVDSVVDSPAAVPLTDGICVSVAGGCTLRAAIMKANHFSGGGVTIQVPAGLYLLAIAPSGLDDETTGDLNITQDMTLIGGGAASTIIDGGGLDRVFHVESLASVKMQGLTLQNGALSVVSTFGAGLQNDGSLALVDSAVSNNSGGDLTELGNAIFSQGTLTLTRVTVSDNIGQADGGVYLLNSAATITASAIYGNETSGDGGGILCDGCALTLAATGIDSNKAPSGSGGGVYVTHLGSVVINRSALTDNSANFGGGLDNNGSSVDIVNTTLSFNDANTDGGGICDCNGSSATNLYNVTIADNQADADFDGVGAGGGIASYGTGLVITGFVDSIVALNFETISAGSVFVPAPGDCFGTLTSNGFDIMNVSSGCTINGTAVTLADPLIGSLQVNGGPTPTQALLVGSPAIDAGNPSGCLDHSGSVLTVDQRGVPRPVGLQCDIGAYEYVPVSIFLPSVLN